jgi:hypothetical protein|tara:strand:- start:2527 stop:3201 length:675 start_codon:yes stop_codon:yes gene_type:complete
MIYRDIINEVLRRLREDQMTDWSGNLSSANGPTDYHKMVGDFVNDAKYEVEHYWDWQVLRVTSAISTSDGVMSYSLLGAGRDFKVLDVIDTSTGTILNQMSSADINTRVFPTANIAKGEPSSYGFNGIDDNLDMVVDVWPLPNDTRRINFNVVKPQDKLQLAETHCYVNEQAVILGAYMRALAERGEDGGTQVSVAAGEYVNILSRAVQIDAGKTQMEMTWYAN